MRSTKYASSRGASRARWPLKMTRSKQESTATIRLVNLATKRASVFMAFSSGKGLCNPYSGGRTPSLLILFGCGYAALGVRQELLYLPFDRPWLDGDVVVRQGGRPTQTRVIQLHLLGGDANPSRVLTWEMLHPGVSTFPGHSPGALAHHLPAVQ